MILEEKEKNKLWGGRKVIINLSEFQNGNNYVIMNNSKGIIR